MGISSQSVNKIFKKTTDHKTHSIYSMSMTIFIRVYPGNDEGRRVSIQLQQIRSSVRPLILYQNKKKKVEMLFTREDDLCNFTCTVCTQGRETPCFRNGTHQRVSDRGRSTGAIWLSTGMVHKELSSN